MHGMVGEGRHPDLMVKYDDDYVAELARVHQGDAGLDLYCTTEAIVVPPGGFVDIPLGVSVEIPEGYWAMLTGRSSTLRKRGLLVNQGVISVALPVSNYAVQLPLPE